VLPNHGSVTRCPPWLLMGSLGRVTPLSIATTQTLRLPSPIPAARFFSPARLPCLLCFLRAQGSKRPLSLVLGEPGEPIRHTHGGREALPASRGTPMSSLPCSSTPGGSIRQTIHLSGLLCWADRCCPRFLNDEGSTIVLAVEAHSHGFKARCLRFMPPSLTTMQDSLPAVGQTLPDGIVYPLGSA
jgi:hypothetical protein